MQNSSSPPTAQQLAPCYFPALLPHVEVSSETEPEVRQHHPSRDQQQQHHTITFTLDLGLEVEFFCDSHDVSPASVFQFAWVLVLACFVGRDDVAFGFLDLQQSQSISSCSASIDRAAPAIEAVQALQKQYHGATRTQTHLPTEKNPAVNTLLCVVHDAAANQHLHEPSRHQFDLTVGVSASDDVVAVSLRCNTALMSLLQAASVGSSFSRILHTILGQPHVELQQLHAEQELAKSQLILPNKAAAFAHHDAETGHATWIPLDQVKQQISINLSGVGSVEPILITPSGIDSHLQALVAFFTLASQQRLDHNDELQLDESDYIRTSIDDLKQMLTSRLPSHMVPSFYVSLTYMPMTSSGAVDYCKLQTFFSRLPESLSPELDDSWAYVATPSASSDSYDRITETDTSHSSRHPTTPAEEKMRGLWASTFDISPEDIGLDDSFFLYGDSVSAMNLVAAARNVGLQLAVAQVFTSPTLADLAAAAVQLAEDEIRTELRAFELLTGNISVSEAIRIVAEQCEVGENRVEDMYPSTALQEGLMALTFTQQASYVFQCVCSLPASLDIERFKAAWVKVVRENEILRTRIVYLESVGTMQAVLHEDSIEWNSGSDLNDYLALDKAVPVEYGAPLTRFAIIGHPHQDHHFVWTIHHALYDAWSMSLILDAVDCVYGNSIKSGLTNVSFNRFVQHVANTDIDESKEFWTAYLLDANATLFPLPSLDDKIVRVNGTLSSKLDLQRTAASNITAATVIRAAWGAVVARYSDSDDVIFGSTLTGRNAPVPGINTVVGPTITTVPIRARIDRSMTFAQFLQTMQTDMIAMISYEHVGLQTLKRWGGFTQAACNFQNLLVIQLEHDRHAGKNHMGLDFDRRTRSGPENYSLMMECTLLETGIDIHVDYDQTLVSPQQMERIIRQFEHVLLQLNTESQTKTMADLEIFSSWDHQLVNTWNGKDLPTKMACVHELFEEVSKTQPAAQAICSWDVNLSYEELDQLSTTFALHLQDLGVTTETIVPSLFEKSAWAHVAHIATLKAGGAVVCLDPNHPEGRRKMILTDVRANVVLTSPAYAGLFRDVQHVVTVDADSMERLSRFTKPERPLKRIVQPSNAALVIYTSGSTGEPKGVVLEHASVCTGMQAHGDALRIGQQTRALNFSAYVFDASIEDTYTQLTRGGCICIPSEVQRLNDIAGAIRATNANWIGITPTTASTIDPSSVPTLDTLILGGERVPQTIVDRWKDSVTYMYNGYGPTEGTLYATLNPQLGKNGRSSNVGWGLHTKLWVVEPGNPDRLTPVGCSGELVIEGPQLARCYLNDPVKTNAAFIVDPAFSRNQDTTEPRRRMYRTGDLVRYCDDGSLEVIGRMDSQTKLHGQRLELGEIEHHLMSSNDIENAMAILSTDPQGTKRIMAIIALRALPGSELNTTDDFNLIIGDARKEIEPTITQIRKKLENNMPTYMVPTVWAIVDNIPRNTSQKIDRAGVTTWAASLDSETYLGLMGTGVEGVSALPINRMAALLRSVIGRVLNRPDEQLPVNRSFTNLGGDSITAMQVVAHCRAKGLRLFVKDILHSESIAQLSELVETMDGGGSVYKAHHKEPLDRVFALAPVQEMYFEAMGQKPTQFNQSFLLQVSRPVAIPELTAAVEAVVTRHSMLRARFLQQSDGRWRQLITADVATSYRFRVKELASPEEVAPAFLECQHGLDVEHGPLLGIDVLLMKDGSQLLALAAHHLVIDFVSWRVVLQDLEDYLITGSTAVERPFSFQNWTKLQAEYAHEHLDADVVLPFDIAVADFNYWGMTTELNTYGDVACHTFLLDRETTSLIFDKCNDAFSTEPVEILLAAAIHSFCQVFPDRQAPTVWREAHGRETWDAEIDLSSVVGWFTNLAPLHVQVVPDSDIVATARAVKDVSRKLPQNGWSYFTCRYLTEKGREKFKDHSPIELLFNYVGHFQQLERQDALFRMQPPRTDVLEPRVGADVPRMSLFEVSVSVIEGKLEFQIMYPSGMQRVAGIYHWAAAYDRTLREAAALLPVKEAEKTLSDFPLLPLGYSGLEALRSERVQQLGLSGLEDIETVYPCAPMQEALLVGQALHKGAYETNVTFEVTSTLRQTSVDVDRLQGAWEAVIAHHPMLRTVFMDSVANEGLYDQIVLRSFIGITHRVHCTDESGPATLDALEYMEQSTTEPLHRFIICTTPTKVFCRIDFHHATIDAASLRTLLDDMRLAYDGGLHHGARPEFSEYIKYLQTKSLSTAMDFWEDRLAEASPCHFPVSDGGGEKTMRTVDVHLDWIPALLRDFVSRTGVTLPNLVQTAWALVLHCYTGLDNISFGYLVGGRNLDVKDVDRIVGPLINMLVCNIDVAGSTNVIDLLHLARDQYAESLDYQHVSLGSVQHALGLSAGTPLFNTAMSSLHTSSTISKFQSRNAEAKQRQLFFDVMTFHDPTEYDITFTLKADDDNPMLSLVHWTPRVSDWLADNALASLTKVIQSLIDVAIADGPLSELEFFSERDRDLISQWNSTQVPAENTCIHHVFEQRVKETPSAEALCNADRSMTYLELDTFATRLALELQRHDIGPDVIVPLCFEKSSWAVVSMIAVMKAGGAFVPLDPSHPEFRLRQIIQSKGIYGKMILTSKAQISLFETLECETFVVDENTCNSLPTAAVTGANVAPHNLAYVIFTSGTTGKPKGTLIEHAAFTTNAREHSKILSINSSSRVLQFASYVFDASILEIFTTLMQGGTICIPTEEERGSMEIVGAINRMGVTWTLLTPSFATVIEPSKVPGLKTVVLGGEAMSKKHIDTWSPHVILINAYGPSESAVIASINADVQEASNIGHAVGALAWIADRNNSDRLVPVGAVGELLLEGPTLSRGYLNETAKTRAAFIDGPAWALGRRFYKTGDLVRYNPDGSLTYLGRKDTQVKVRGQRLEISEIENHLYASKLVKDAVVVMPSAGPRQKTLVGVVTLTALRAQSRNGKPLQVVDRSLQAGYVREISDKLGQTLPSYMVPPMWIVVEQMPLNTSGKLDRSRVSKWVERLGTDFYHRIAREDSLTGDPVEQPVTDMEAKIQELISNILNIPAKQVSSTQSFIGLGGDSITAMQMVSRCRGQGISLKMTDILRSKNIYKMAQSAKFAGIAQQQHTEASEVAFDLSPIQQMFTQMDGMPLRFNQSFFVRLARPTSLQSLSRAINSIVTRHSMLRARFFKSQDGNWRQLIKRDIHGSYHLQSHEIQSLDSAVPTMASSQRSLNPENGPLFSIDLFNVCGNGQFLYLVAHHLVIDMVSWRLVLQDLEQLLESSKALASDGLPFQSWCKLLSEYAGSQLQPKSALPFKIQAADFTYWDMESKPNTYADIERRNFSLDLSVSTALLEQCHTALGTEPVELLLAALFHSFAIVFPDRMTPTIFSEGHGRETWDSSIDMSNTVGWFTTMAPLQVPVSGDSVVDVVRRTKDVRRSVPRNGFDYFALRYLTEQGRELFGKAGPTEVLFNYLGQYQQLERSDSLLRQEALPSGAVLGDFDENLHRFALFEINAVVSHGIISVQFLYNRHMARKADVQRWIDVNTQSLKDIANILPAMAAEKTLTDFPLVPLTYDGLREIHDAVLPELGFNTIDDIEDIYPCSPMQQGLLVSQTRNSEAYKTSFKFKVLPNHTEFVDSGRLLEAWQGVVDRHAMLRTIFTERASNNGLFDQLVLVKSKANTVFIECDTDEEATSQLNNFPMVEFNNFTTPHRLLVCQSGSGKVFFRLDASHALLDAASVGALLRDIAHTYEYTQARGQGPLYSDYIKYLNSKPAEDSIKFWKKYLERVMPCYLPVHNDEPDLSVPSQLRSIRLTFSHLSVLMKRFCEKCSVTMPTVFHVAWSVVLRMYTGSEDVCYGYLVSGRDIPLNGIEESIGPFINMMVSRTHLTEESSLLELAQQKQAEYAAGIEHQSCSLAEVQHALGLSDQPLFNTMISIQNLAAKKTPEELALSFESIGSHDPTEYDVSLGIYTSDTEAEAYFGYWSAKMSDWHAENITDTFLKVLELLLENPEGNITNLRQLSDRDAQQMEHWTPLRQSEEGTLVHRLFENQVAKSPSSIAIDGFDGSFSYSELDSLSTRFSQHLIGLGVRPTDVVPLCFHKSAWAIIAMLSILRAGATCLPLAPSHPLDRMRGMLEDSEAKVVVCASDLASRLKPLGTKLVKLSPTEISQIPEAKSRHTVNIDPESSAFLLYTSGSTGVPKGVMMPHRAISTNVPVMAKNWGFNRSSRILQFVAYTFDPSIGDIFGALSTGACLCIVSEEDRMRDMTPIINSLNISHIVLTPSLARTLNPQKLAGLQFMIMGGEPITERDIAMWMDHVKLINAYGPTEATIAVTSIRYWKHKHIDPRNIGRSFLSSLAVADPDNIQHPVPIGAVGELLIGGPTLANGYLKDDEKTRRAFVKAPKWTQSTSFLGMPRMYRTGDLVRWASDGTIHFIGRKDTQIKIRGQRVEAGEIEHCIKSSLDGLKDLTVALTKPRNRSMDLVLTAFLSWETENDKTSAELMIPVTGSMKSILIDLDLKLANLLPSYMIPVLYIPVGFIPLSGTGKTDLPRLQSLVAHLSDEELSHFSLSDGPKRAPTTRMQRRLHQIWAEVLDIEPIHIGQDDGFFRIGGDSLSAIRLASLASQNDIQLNIALIFQNPKLNEMSAAAEAIKSKSVYEQLENQFSIPQDKVQDFYPCTPFQEGLMLLSMKQPGAYRERNNWTLPASTNLELFKAAFQVVSQRESILRTRIVSLESTGSLQVVINETVSISDVTSEAEFLEAEEKTPMIYGQSLMKCSILQGDGSSPRFMLTMHHALYDEWSINLILNHVESIYHSLNQTESVYSNPSPQSFSSFVDHIVQTNEQDAQTFWKSQLVGALPVDFPRLPGASYQPAKSSTFRHHMKLCRTQTSGASNSILLRAAWLLLVATYSGSNDVTIGLTMLGRDVPIEGIDSIAGPTLATVPLRSRINWSMSIKQFLVGLQNQAKKMQDFEHFGMQRIAQSVPEADGVCNFQHLFVIHDRQPNLASKDFWKEEQLEIASLNQYPLILECYLNELDLELAVRFDETVIEAHQLEMILASFKHIINQLIAGPGTQPLNKLSMLSEQDQQAIIQMNQTMPIGMEKRIDELFDIQRLAQPNAEAVSGFDASFTYQELYDLSIRLGHHLQEMGIGPEVLVPLLFDKSAWTVVAMLGVLFAGGGFIPMDATHPVHRFQQIIEDSNAPLVLASQSRKDLCKTIAPQTFVVSPETIKALPRQRSPPANNATPRNTAYILFTSGSTGKPKGVVTEHRGICTAAIEQAPRINLNANSRVLSYSSYAFEVTILETFHTLFHGGCVCPISQGQRMNDLVGAINQLKTNWAFFTPSLVRTFTPEQVPCMKTVILGGEALGADNIEVWANKTHLGNGYGPTETCVFSSILDRITENDRPDNIGKAVGGVCWITSAEDHNVLVPIGAVGELLIEGPTVARGYLNDPVKTEKAFIERPVWLNEHALRRPVERVYKTGDLVTQRPDGTIYIIGRKDTQVKIRGQRVELGEVEHYLKLAIHNLAHIAVDQIFLPRRDSAKVLAAFLCSDGKEKTSEPKPTRIPHQLHSDPTIWTSGLAISLPAYMIPTMFIFLDWMPLTSSGKTDRRRLQEVARRLTDEEIMHFSLADAEKRSPVTEMEMRMQSIWAIVLSIPAESIGLDDSFVRLGGDSLTAMRLAVIARQAGISIMVDHIFKNPTLGAMASVATTLEDEVAKDLKPFSLLRGAEPINAIMSKLDRSYGIPMESVEDIYPTSSLQEGLMILSVRQPGTYSFQWISALPPTVDRQRFINAWKKCVKRNTILRTRIIYTELSGSLQVVLNDEDQWTTSGSLNDFLKNDKLNFMDYGKPLTRWAFVDDESGKSHFVWSAHHSIYDGWALPMVLQEVALIYQSTDISHLPAPAPYARFIEYLEHKDKEGEEAWWRLHFPEDKVMSSFPPVQSSAIQPLANVTVTKDIQFSGSLSSGFTTSTLIRAAWAIVLSRYSESNDALFGALLAGRNVPIKDIATMTGPTITTVPVHVHVKPDQSIHSFLESVQNQAIEMMPYEHMGLQNIKRISRKTQEACNFQNLLVIQPRQERNESNYLWRTENTVNFGFDEFLTFPLVFQVELGDKSLSLTVKLDDRLLTAERGQRMLEHFSNVIIQLDKESNKRLSDVEITSSLDFTDLQIWNDMSSGLTSLDTCVHDLISEQARLSPDASAICSWDVNFTYAELDSLSSRVAGHLSSLGVGLETYVLLCFDKSAWAIVAMLGVLKSGAAYVAIDPTHPVDRKEFISRNVAATVAMTSLQHRYMFESLVKHVVGIDRATVEKFATNFSLQQVPSSNPAFVVFTSGSTGTPKGIVMEHGAFSTGARAHASALNINRHARVFQFAAYTYDVSMGEIFSTLMHGGCICVPSEDERLSNLANAINKMKATWLFLTPTVAALLQPSAVKTLQYLILGGEHATASNINSWAESVCLINSYGPAECAIWTNCTPGLASNADPSNIGRCIGSRLWIVEADNHNKLTPLGCVGELVVESPSLARGYLNDLVKTTDAFIETPKWAVSDSQTSPRRMYKTGDLAKYNFDGTLSIVGRKDTQVKLNGQRMELGEVEHHLWADKHVSKAMAVVPNAGCCMKHLVAIISLHHLGKVSNQQFALVEGNKKEEASAQVYCLREHLASKLPKYMVPTLWVVLEDLPLNASGKLDRRLVTEWVKEMDEDLYLSVVEIGQGDKVKSQPLNEMERLIRGLWAKILNISEDRIGMDDNFLQAGGDSISAVRLSAGARHAGILLLVRDIFLNPTLRAMSAAASWEKLEEETIAHEPFSILETEGISTRLEDIAIETNQELDNIEDVLEASDYQSWALSAGHLKTRGYLNYFGIKFDGELDLQRIQGACRTVIAHHPILRTVFVMRDQRVLQVILKNYNLEFTFYERQDDSNDGISHALIREDMERPVKLGERIVRFMLVKQGANSHQLVLHISHAQYDGISLPSILQDIKNAYQGSTLSNSSPFTNFIHSVRDQDCTSAETYWKTTLKGSRMTNILTHHKPPYENAVDRMISRVVSPTSLTSQGITFASTVKAAWALVLSQLSLTSDISFGQVVSGRNTSIVGIEEIVGPCMNILPVRVAIQPTWTNSDLVHFVQNQHLSSMQHESLGMRRIIEACTNWPKKTRFSSIHQHTNFGSQFFGEVLCASAGSEMTGFAPPHDAADVWIWTAPLPNNKFSVDFTFSDRVLSEEMAQMMLDMLCDNILEVSSNFETNVTILKRKTAVAMLPITYGDEGVRNKLFIEDSPQSAAAVADAEELAEKVWLEVFGEVPPPDVAFWDVRGDLMVAVQLAECYNRETGLKFSVETIIEHGSMRLQTMLLLEGVRGLESRVKYANENGVAKESGLAKEEGV